jgi:raffinose/stachyose/melibiose transport system substrate-binding protein
MTRKRILFLVCASFFLLAVLAVGSQEKVTINWANFWNRGDMGPNTYPYDLVDKYVKAHPNVQLKIDSSSHDDYISVKYKTWVVADTLPELFMVLDAQIIPSVQAKRLMDWTDTLNADPKWKNSFLDLWGETTVNGRTYGIPWQFITNEAFYYNADILKKVGYNSFPATWEDMLVMSEKLKGMGYIPIALGDKGGWPMWSHLGEILCEYIMGPDWVKEVGTFTGKKDYTDPRFLTIMNMINDLWKKGYFNSDILAIDHGTDDLGYFFNGKAATTLIGSWGVQQMVTNAPKEMLASIKVAPIPRPSGSVSLVKAGMFTGGSGWEWGANTKLSAAQKKVVVDIVKILTGTEYAKYAIEAGNIPVLKMQYVTGWNPNKVPVLLQDMNKLVSAAPRIPRMNQQQGGPAMSEVLYKACEDMIAGAITPEQAVQNIQDTFARVVAEMQKQ